MGFIEAKWPELLVVTIAGTAAILGICTLPVMCW